MAATVRAIRDAVEGYMRPVMLIPVGIFLALGASAAWVEYSQHSGLMRSAAIGDVAQLCADLRAERVCPKALTLRARAAKDPWSQPYHCRPTPRGLLIYTLGANDEVGGPRRDSDLACNTVYSQSEAGESEPCTCYEGEEASALLR